MPMRVACPCGGAVTVLERAAGSSVRCPKCRRPIQVPSAAPPPASAPPVPVDPLDIPMEPGRVPCAYCAEMILPAAKICPFCKSKQGRGGGPPRKGHAARRAGSGPAPDDTLSAVDIIICILFPCIGIIIGLVSLTSGRTGRGGKMLGISFVVALIAAALSLMARHN